MGSLDKLLRFVSAVIVAALYFMGVISGTLGIVLLGIVVSSAGKFDEAVTSL